MNQKTLVLIYLQQTRTDLFESSKEAQMEKDNCLERFMEFGNKVLQALQKHERGPFWADLLDPCSGYPVHSVHGGMFFNDLEPVEVYLKFPYRMIGNCHVAVHPEWGTRMYPSTMLIHAPIEIAQEICDSVLCTQVIK